MFCLLGYKPEIILAGRMLNDKMDNYIVDQFSKEMKKKSIKLNKSKILVLGITFKENCPDIRNSKVINVINKLKKLGCMIKAYDPYIYDRKQINKKKINVIKKLKPNTYDGIIIAVNHKKFKKLGLKKIKSLGKINHVIYDLRYAFKKKDIEFRL